MEKYNKIIMNYKKVKNHTINDAFCNVIRHKNQRILKYDLKMTRNSDTLQE